LINYNNAQQTLEIALIIATLFSVPDIVATAGQLPGASTYFMKMYKDRFVVVNVFQAIKNSIFKISLQLSFKFTRPTSLASRGTN